MPLLGRMLNGASNAENRGRRRSLYRLVVPLGGIHSSRRQSNIGVLLVPVTEKAHMVF